jgi:GSCFA family
MDFQLPLHIKPLPQPIRYTDYLMLMGSCFTEHIGGRLDELKFNTLQNPNGILFDPISVCNSLVSYIEQKEYNATDLFYLNELWQSWQHHSKFSGIDKMVVLNTINHCQQQAHFFLKKASWLIITLGSSFSYHLVENNMPVANCHRAPAQTFKKHLLGIEEIIGVLDNTIHRLFHFNPSLQIIFTISPVRHIRDGVVENNRSKARLLEVVHHLVNKFNRLHYFAAYELVIDVLRDYRFYDVDMVHPNYPATEFVFEKFTESCIDKDALESMKAIKQVVTAARHKAFEPATQAHQKFLQVHLEKTKNLQQQMPYLNFSKELDYFSQAINPQ